MTATSSGNWSTGSNWSLGTPPASYDNVIFNALNTSNSTIDTAFTISGLNILGYTGTISQSANLTDLGAYTQASGTFNGNGYTNTVTGLTTISGGIYTGGSAAQNFNGGLTISGGTVTLSAAASYSAATTLNSGTLTINNASALGTSAITIGNATGSAAATLNINYAGTFGNTITVASPSSGTLSITSNAAPTFSSTITLNNNLTLIPALGDSMTLGGITGTGNLTISGAGNTTLAGTVSIGGMTDNSTGTVTQSGNLTTTGAFSQSSGTFTSNLHIHFPSVEAFPFRLLAAEHLLVIPAPAPAAHPTLSMTSMACKAWKMTV